MSLPASLQEAVDALLTSPGATEPSLRRVVLERLRSREARAHAPAAADLPLALADFLDKLAERPWTICDADFTRLRAAGYSDDQLYELTLASSIGAGLRRFDAGLRALGEDS
jgi:alkylhydroperoxidase family enzyme